MKKIIAVFLVAFMTLTVPGNVVWAQDGSVAEDVSAYEDFVLSLNVIDAASQDKERLVSRGEFIDMIVRAMNKTSAEPQGGLFTDVPASNMYAGAISTAANLGIIAGDGDGVFKPDSPITFDAAIKITVAALGYTNLARLRGDYPVGYLSVAKSLDLTDGLDDLNSFTYDKCIILIFNFLHADLCRVSGIINNEIEQYRAEGKNLLTENFKLTLAEGIIKSAGFESMVPGESISQSTIKVGSLALGCDINNAEKYLGKSAQCWYDEQKQVRAIYVSELNQTVTIAASDLERFEAGVLVVDDSIANKELTYKIDPAYTFVKNGRYFIPENSDFVYQAGEMTLIDNDGDCKYDVVKADVAEYMVVSGVNTYEEIIYDTKSGTFLETKADDDFYCRILIADKTGVIKEGSLDDISQDSVLMVYKSHDGKYCRIVSSVNSFKGSIDEMGTHGVVISRKGYKTNSYFDSEYKAELGLNGRFLVAFDGTLTAFEDGNDKMSYGYLVDYAEKSSAFDKRIRIGILTTSDKVIYAELADKVVLDGNAVEKNNLSAYLVENNIPVYQVLKYSISQDGKINCIDLASPAPDGEEKYEVGFIGDNSLTQYVSKTSSDWWNNASMFAPYAFYGSTTVVFGVPFASNAEPEKYEVDDFSCFSPVSLGNYLTGVVIDAYDIDKELNAGAIVRYGHSSKSVDKNSTLALVESVVDALNPEGERAKRITYWKSGRFYSEYIPMDLYASLDESGNVPGAGDVVRIVSNTEGEVSGVLIDIDFDQTDNSINYGPGIDGSDFAVNRFGNLGYSVGKVLTHTSASIVLKVNEKTAGGHTLENGMLPFGMASNVTVAVYDTKSEIVKHGKLEMISDAYATGESNASTVAVRTYDGRVSHVFIYK
ncbi:MAG: S-layer homology domain-containing protein [Clostridia bacterium]|nr:S-layer homology domain-containing protein [Clostridia bacterium]